MTRTAADTTIVVGTVDVEANVREKNIGVDSVITDLSISVLHFIF